MNSKHRVLAAITGVIPDRVLSNKHQGYAALSILQSTGWAVSTTPLTFLLLLHLHRRKTLGQIPRVQRLLIQRRVNLQTGLE